MSKKQQNDTDLVDVFKDNLHTLAVLIGKVDHVSKTNLDPIVQVKLKELRSELLIEDVKLQESKITRITNVLDEICSPKILPTD